MLRINPLIILILLTHQFIACMDTSKISQQFLTLIPKEQPNQPCIIPIEHAKQCQPIANLFKDLSDSETPVLLPDLPIENVSGKDVLNFVFYLEDIYNINQLSKDDTKGQQPFHNCIAQQIKSLKTRALINLFTIVDILDVVDRNNNHWIVDEVSSRFLANLDQASVFHCLNGKPLFRGVVQNISKHINFEQKYIHPYANTLTQRQELERTVSPLTAAWYNITNKLTAPIRWFGSPSWAIKTIMRPYYLNSQTGTMITGFVQKLDPKDKIVRLLITNKKTNQNQTISLDGKNIETIQQIEANTAETAFICKTNGNKFLIIDILNQKSPIINHDFSSCVFSKDDSKLYAIKEHKEFGVFDIKNAKFEPLEKLTDKFHHAIRINKNKTNLILCSSRQAGIDEHGLNKYMGEIWIWKNCNESQLSFTQNICNVFEAQSIYNICLHPTEDTFCVQYRDYKDNADLKIACININKQEDTKKIVPLSDRIPIGSVFQFIENSDILFICPHPPKKAAYKFLEIPLQDDYFVNTRNGHMWSKKKRARNESWIGINKNEIVTNDNYERMTLTSDGMKSIEQVLQGNFLFDFMAAYASDNNNGVSDLSIRKIIAAPLIDETIMSTIQSLNEGFLSPQIIAALLNNSNHEKTNTRSDQGAQKMIESISNQGMYEKIKTFISYAGIIAIVLLKCKMESSKQEKEYERTYKYKPISKTEKLPMTFYGINVEKTIASLIAGALILFFLDRVCAQY